MLREHSGLLAWGTLGAAVAVYDAVAPETLSTAYARAREHENKVIRYGALGGLALLTGHLLDAWPSKVDPIDGRGKVIRGAVRR